MPEPLAVSTHHHMHIRWHNLAQRDSVPVTEASLTARAAVVGRVGIMMLACGTGAWRVREAMDRVSRRLHLTCSADVGLIAISFTCFENGHHYSQTLSLAASGVNTDKLSVMETFVDHFDSVLTLTPQEIHTKLDGIQQKPGNYTPALLGLASAVHAYRRGFPRISLTVPAIVIMVPGLYMYRGMYALGLNHFAIGGSWLVRAIMIVVALPLGLATARILTDKKWRHIS